MAALYIVLFARCIKGIIDCTIHTRVLNIEGFTMVDIISESKLKPKLIYMYTLYPPNNQNYAKLIRLMIMENSFKLQLPLRWQNPRNQLPRGSSNHRVCSCTDQKKMFSDDYFTLAAYKFFTKVSRLGRSHHGLCNEWLLPVV